MRFANPMPKAVSWALPAALAVITAAAAGETTAAAAEPAKLTLVVCSPGSPGTTDEAQPRMDAFAAAVTAKAGTPIAAVYEPSEASGASHLRSAGAGVVSLPFFFKHEQELGLRARLVAVGKGRPPLDRWALVGAKGRIKSADDLANVTVFTAVAFAPAFVRGVVLGGLGAAPASAKLVQSTSVLSALRRAANGEPVAVVLDGTQEASLASLPFAAKLDAATRSAPLPVALVVTAGDRIPAKAWDAVEHALAGVGAADAEALRAIELDRFAPLDGQAEKALDAARKSYADASK